MDGITQTSLDALLHRATDCRNKNTDTAAIDAFCGIIKKEPEGPSIAARLIALKIQSPQEWEALQGLTVLETCMKTCGSSFHSEIGKFRFLNEMIKLVSPKYLGSRTPISVRDQVLKMMFNWTVNYPKESKIKEAYDMLIKQGVVPKDEIPLDDSRLSSIPPRASPLFQDDEKVRLLQKLLRSKNPEDLQAANRLIKTMVKEDEKRVEIKSKRVGEVETVRNNVRLLSEMLDSYRLNQTSSEELELIKDLYEGCEGLKKNVFKLASETHENDEFLNQVLAVSDELDQVLDKYKNVIILGKSPTKTSVSSLLDLSSPVDESVPVGVKDSDILNQPIPDSGLGGSIDAMFLSSVPKPETNNANVNPLDAIFSSLGSQNGTKETNFLQSLEQQGFSKIPTLPPSPALPASVSAVASVAKPPEKNSKLKPLEELDVLLENLLQECKTNATKETNKETDKTPESTEPLPINNEPTEKPTSTLEDDILMDLTESPTKTETQPTIKELKPLTDISVSLESIKPSSVPPINVIEEKNGISVTIYMAKDTPRDDVTVFVVTTISKNQSSLSNYLFQAVVPKGCKIKLQPPSGSDLPPHNPFLPPSAITQIMLIANPNKLPLALKCMISYTMDDETVTEMGEVEQLPMAT